MFNFGKKSSTPSRQPITVHLLDAQKRAEPIPFTLNSTDLTGLLIEAIQLGKLLTTEQRDLEAIRSDYKLRSEYLADQHNQIINEIDRFYNERENTINQINQKADLFIASGQYDIAEGLLKQLIQLVASNSPLRSAMDLRDKKLLS